MPPETLRAAFEYLEHGWTPLPLQPRSKQPLLRWHRLQRERPKAANIEQWWSLWPEANVGILTGAASRLAVVDLDGPEAQALTETHGLPDAPTVRTGEGIHIYCSVTGPMRSAVGLRPGIDLRADGGYVVAPPSIHPSGRSYVWVVPPGNVLPPLPAWALPQDTQGLERKARWAVAALQGVEQGRRNATCARLAGHFLAHGIASDVIEVTLLAWNGLNRPPLPEAEVRRTVTAIVTRGQRQCAEALPGTEGSLVEFLAGPWSKDCTHGERSTYQAVCIVEYERGLPIGAEMYVSYRELHSRGAVSPQSAKKVLTRLARRGLIEFRPAGRTGGLRGLAATIRRLSLLQVETNQLRS
jgi:hypothetical protein